MAKAANRHSGSYTFGIFLIIFGILLLLDQMDIMDFGDFIRTFWPLILVYFGVKMIFFPRERRGAPDMPVAELVEEAAGEPEAETEAEIRLVESRVLGDIRRQIRTKTFAGGRFSVTFGDVDIDAKEMGIQSGQRTLYLSCTMGDIRLRLPENLPCLVRASCTAGELNIWDIHSSGLFIQRSYKMQDFDTATTRLIVVAKVVFGDINIW
ncbi:MAG: hypothetical protein D6814_08085 [Calditrichaeota bacterium]|nr:MAG: hypothetical protein D6814_08085 [Calditrichota bacterium]